MPPKKNVKTAWIRDAETKRTVKINVNPDQPLDPYTQKNVVFKGFQKPTIIKSKK